MSKLEHYLASMRGKINVDALYRKALDQVRGLDWPSPACIPDSCPYTHEQLISDAATVSTLLAKLGQPA